MQYAASERAQSQIQVNAFVRSVYNWMGIRISANRSGSLLYIGQ